MGEGQIRLLLKKFIYKFVNILDGSFQVIIKLSFIICLGKLLGKCRLSLNEDYLMFMERYILL